MKEYHLPNIEKFELCKLWFDVRLVRMLFWRLICTILIVKTNVMKKKWLITGASSGIGRVMTEKLLERGDAVFATMRNTQALSELQEKYPEQLAVKHLEITDTAEIQSVVNAAFLRFGTIDRVVSNAGYGMFGSVEELTNEMIEHQIQVNLLGSIWLIKAVIPHLRKQGGGHIVQVSSEGGQSTYPGFSIYHASKWGIEGFIDSISKELKIFNIHCTLAEPGPTQTNFGANLAIGEPMTEYKDSPVHEMQTMIMEGRFAELDDVSDVADLIIHSADKPIPPLRITIGKVANTNVEAALNQRLKQLKSS